MIFYSSFQAAAIAKGFVTEINQAMLCCRQHMETSLAREMRGLFASMTINGFPTIRIFEDNDLMMKDQSGMSNDEAKHQLLVDEGQIAV